jgi:hypothetical protein
LSEGSIYGTSQVIAAKTTGTSVRIDWVNNLYNTSALATDNVNLIFFKEAEKEAVLLENCAQRAAETVEVELPPEWAGGKVHSWIYFTDEDGLHNSLSKYISLV